MQLPFWKDLTERERETVQRSAVTRRYEKGALIHDGGSECLGLVLVLSGELRTYLLSDEGREVTLFRLYAGDLCVLSASCVISQITFDTQMTASGIPRSSLSPQISLPCSRSRIWLCAAASMSWPRRGFLT